MTIAVSEQPVARCAEPLDREGLARLADTFDDALTPVWIHALDGRCLYANRRAGNSRPGPGVLKFDLLNPEGQLVAHMRTDPA